MIEKAKGYLEKVKSFFKKVSKKVYIALIALLAIAAVLVVWLNNQPYEVLFTELNTSEMSSILNYMEEAGVTDYKIENSDTILVQENQVNNLRAKLLMEGYPQSGFAYTYSESSGVLSTESERKQSALRDLQDRLSATVQCFDGVKEAVVNINPGEDLSYVLDSNRTVKASAAVFVTMSSNAELSAEQAEAIRRLVAHSVSGLEIDSVTIEDSVGNQYNSDSSFADDEASALKLQLEQQWENKIRKEVMRVLTPWYGEDNVTVAVRCTVDVSQTIEDSTEVYLPDYALDGSTNGTGIIGSRIFNYVVVRDTDETEGGVVGTETNADLSEYVENLDELTQNATEFDISGQIDYDNSRSQKHIVQTAGYLTNCTISVSINSEVAGDINSQEISRHIARAAGIEGTYDEVTGEEYLGDKISVMAMPFYVEEVPEIPLPIDPETPVEMWMIYAAAGALLLLLIILLVVILIIRKKRKKKKKAQEEEEAAKAADIEAFLAAAAAARDQNASDSGADVMSIQSEKSLELRQDIRKFAEDNPEIAAQMLKGWLRGAEDDV